MFDMDLAMPFHDESMWPYETHFADALYFYPDKTEDMKSAPGSVDGSQSSNMLPRSSSTDGSLSSSDGPPSAATPDPPLGSSPHFDISEDRSRQGSHEELIGLRRYDDKLTTPQLDPRQDLPRPSKLHITHIPDKTKSRHRVVKNVDKVNQVRGAGACNRCRLQKVPCTILGICETCIKACPLAPEVCCTRKDLATVGRECHKRLAGLNRKHDDHVREVLRVGRPEFSDVLFEGRIYFDRECLTGGLPACLRNYTCAAPGGNNLSRGCTFSRDRVQPALMQEEQLKWAERCELSEDFRTFEGAVESLIKTYAKSGGYIARQRPQFALVDKAHTFKSMYKIYHAPGFFFADKHGNGVVELPLPAQAEMRGVARAALESAERDMLAELDKCLKTPKVVDKDKPAVWAALWQLMFVYRDLLRNVPPWRHNAEPLFNAVAVFYATLFRTTNALKFLEGPKEVWLANDGQRGELVASLESALSLRDTFYQSIVAGVAAIDQRLKVLVVNPEMKVLNRRPNKKTAGGKRGAAHDEDEDEAMGGY
ncbi:hypothetical protein CTRI78_v007219 [Colletotrichum trifolii]|uniref:Uncharacterized protein n=1 Tax=Colletotrichum trifolii TaxID=5466 RepID=A0A4R8R9W0_COLTR|nr:hypothetical protein CTRI78_v007219 [Colletotrichum trifolii]